MLPLRKAFLAVLFLAAGIPATAADVVRSGRLTTTADVIVIPLTLSGPADQLRAWTDSWGNGLNFDPALQLWDATGALIASNDNNAGIGAGQTARDAGFLLTGLDGGDYRLTLTRAPNGPAGDSFADGFLLDGTSIAIPNCGCGHPGAWNLHVDGASVVGPVTPVPEPDTWAMAGAGSVLLALLGRRQRRVVARART